MTESSPARAAAMGGVAAAGEAELGRLLPRPEGSTARLDEAMRYACLGGGKRFRPFLTVACGDLFGVPRPRSLRAGAAIEMLRSEEHTSELQSLMRISYAVFCLKKKRMINQHTKHSSKQITQQHL